VRVRKDGEETRGKILLAALHVFGEKGYRDATHAEICHRAGVNTAAINYHFGSKEGLYQAAYEYAATLADSLYPIDGGVPPEASAKERLKGLLRAQLQRRADEKRLGHFHSIRMTEIVNPTGLLDQAIGAWREKSRTCFMEVIRELLGPEASQTDVELCEMSVVSQCLMAYKRSKKSAWTLKADVVELLTTHIMRFCLAGIEGVRREIESRREGTSRKAANV
jgi:TetR/AcrR family transcriptional regulator, regulator of cefoperazone and chloramphenicol sensitivity